MLGMVAWKSFGYASSDVQCRLLYLVGQLGLGGLERQLYYLLENLDRVRYQPAVIVWNFNQGDKYYRDIEELKIPIWGFPTAWSPLSKLRALGALAQQVAPEVIHSYGFHTNLAAYYAAWRTGALAIGSLRGDFTIARRDGGIIKGALNARWPVAHISNSQTSADAAKQAPGFFKPRQVFVVRNGLDLGQFNRMEDAFKSRHYVAAVGSLLRIKRWDRLLRVIQKLMTSVHQGVRFRIAGDGPLRPTLEKLANDLCISETIEFCGAVHDIPAFLSRARFLVHTSESEGCPNAVMEAMACGLPVVAMEAGDIPYLVKDGRTGFVVPQGDEAAFVESTVRLLGDDGLCFRMGLAAREMAVREFTPERLVSETLTVYRAAGWEDKSMHNIPKASARGMQP